MKDAITTRNLVKRYGRRNALDGFTLSVPGRATMGLVGQNGAGKTTWMMTVAGLVVPSSGETDILGLGPFDAAVHSGRVSILPQDSELPLTARPKELLYRYARLQGIPAKAAERNADGLLAALNLSDRAKTPVRALSHGMRKRVMVAQAFIGNPDVVLLDEPLSGLDPVEADRLRAFILARRGRETMVISSHNLTDIERLCTHVAFIAGGRLERSATLAALTSSSGRVEYALKERPADLSALEGLVSGLSLEWKAKESVLVATFDAAVPPEEANGILVPKLLSCGLLGVTSGISLEQAYLQARRPPA